MDREELRDHLLAPVLAWTRLGRQMSELMVGSMNVIGDRSHQLMRSFTWREAHDWSEMSQMAREKLAVPLESAAAVAAVVPSHVQRCVVETTQTLLACTTSAASLATSVVGGDFQTSQREFADALLRAGLVWYRMWGSAAEIGEEALQPVLRQVKSNAARLGKR